MAQSLVTKMVRAAKLDVDLYEEVEADKTATRQAFQVVLLTRQLNTRQNIENILQLMYE